MFKNSLFVKVSFRTPPHERCVTIAREKEIKGWRREKKIKLILADNPDWADLSAEWEDDPGWKAISEKELWPMLKRRPQEP